MLDPVRHHMHLGGIININERREENQTDARDDFIGIALTSSKNGNITAKSEMYNIHCESTDIGESQIHLLEDVAQFEHSILIHND